MAYRPQRTPNGFAAFFIAQHESQSLVGVQAVISDKTEPTLILPIRITDSKGRSSREERLKASLQTYAENLGDTTRSLFETLATLPEQFQFRGVVGMVNERPCFRRLGSYPFQWYLGRLWECAVKMNKNMPLNEEEFLRAKLQQTFERM